MLLNIPINLSYKALYFQIIYNFVHKNSELWKEKIMKKFLES